MRGAGGRRRARTVRGDAAGPGPDDASRRRRRRARTWPALAIAAVLLAGCGGDVPTPSGTTTAAGSPAVPVPDPRAEGVAYLALGDSLAQGVQRRGGTFATSRQGYPDALAARLRAAGTPVTLSRIGCSGATVESLLNGGKACEPPAPGPLPYRNRDAGTSQLAYAETYLRARGSRPTLVTIDIGANDLVGCAGVDPARVRSCFADGLPRVGTRLREVARRLRAAAGPNTVLATMTYYDPAVVLVRRGFARDAALAFHAVVRREANPTIRRTFAAEGFAVARVDRAFGSDGPVTDEAVDTACRLTRLCASGSDFHPNATGYGVIADAFLKVVRRPVGRLAG